jgi:hypothetical protein
MKKGILFYYRRLICLKQVDSRSGDVTAARMIVNTYTVKDMQASNKTMYHLNDSLQFRGSSGSNGSKSKMTSSCFVSSPVICLSKGCSSSAVAIVNSSLHSNQGASGVQIQLGQDQYIEADKIRLMIG